VRTDVLTDEEFAAFSGVLGHLHVSANKSDPGPAFDWERFLREARAAAD
jgi:N-acetyl-anhydromuramyl-L-alanine amidase AmpD